MKGYGVMDAMIKWIVGFFKNSVPQIFHPCPFSGKLYLPNITLSVRNLPAEQLMPTGLFKFSAAFILNGSRSMTLDTHVDVSTRLERDGK